MVGAVTNFQKPLASQKIKRNKPGVSAVREVRKLKRSSEYLLNKVPYKHLLREFSSDMKTLIDEDTGSAQHRSLDTLHSASQAYLSGIFQGYSNVCPKVAKREGTLLLLYLAQLGLQRVVATLTKDKDIAKAARLSSHHFHQSSARSYHSQWHDLPHLQSNHHHHHHPQSESDEDSDDSDLDEEEERSNNNASDIMTRIRSRISRNVTVTVIRDN